VEVGVIVLQAKQANCQKGCACTEIVEEQDRTRLIWHSGASYNAVWNWIAGALTKQMRKHVALSQSLELDRRGLDEADAKTTPPATATPAPAPATVTPSCGQQPPQAYMLNCS
jgi:hypothetical protein